MTTTPGAASARADRGRPQEGSAVDRSVPLPTHVRDLPHLPEDAVRAYEDGLAELGLADDPEVRAARDPILDHLRLLLAWAQAVNLTAVREPVEAVRRHVIDSLTGLAPLRSAGAERFVDLGTGGGYPGLVLALTLPARNALLVDSVAKKVRFVEAAIRAVGAADRAQAQATRAEALAADPAHRASWPAVTARAVAALSELCELAFPLLVAGGVLVAWKRGDPAVGDLATELAVAKRALPVLGGGIVTVGGERFVSLAGHRVIVVRKAGPTPAGFPRDPAVRRRRPWM